MTAATQIHPSAVIEQGAEIGAGSIIGPFCHIGPHARIGDGCELIGHVTVIGHTSLGPGARVFPHAVLGGEPQNVHYRGEPTTLTIGSNAVIREGVTMHTGMADARGATTVGDNGLFLAYSHIAHDCVVGDHVILSNNIMLGGHVTIGDRVIMGGGSAVHQFCRVGHHAFIGGLSPVHNDVIPYGMVNGNPGRLGGVNIVGMKRGGMVRADIHTVRKAYKLIFEGEGTIAANTERAGELYGRNAAVADIVDFIKTGGDRALCTSGRARGA